VTLEDANYLLVGRRAEERITLLSEKLADDCRAVLVFYETDAAEASRIVEGLGEEWEVIHNAYEEVADLLQISAAAGGAKYVALDPPTALTRADKEPQLIPLTVFLDHLWDPLDDQENP
jgi:hypothetical protein